MNVTTTRGKLLLPGLVVAVAVLILLGLGTWQVYRLRWKQGILAQIAAAEHQAPVPLADTPPAYGRVSVTGRFRFDQAVVLGVDVRDTPHGAVMGHYQLVPLQRDTGPALLVNRGWVPDTATPEQPDGVLTVIGYARPPDHAAWFAPADDPAHRRFYTLDPRAIAEAIGAGPVLPFSLTVLGPAADAKYPIPAADFPRPPNNHLTYALTWYSMAVILLVIFVIRIRKRA